MLLKTITLYNAEGRIIINDTDTDKYLKNGYSKKDPKAETNLDTKKKPASKLKSAPEAYKEPDEKPAGKQADAV